MYVLIHPFFFCSHSQFINVVSSNYLPNLNIYTGLDLKYWINVFLYVTNSQYLVPLLVLGEIAFGIRGIQ